LLLKLKQSGGTWYIIILHNLNLHSLTYIGVHYILHGGGQERRGGEAGGGGTHGEGGKGKRVYHFPSWNYSVVSCKFPFSILEFFCSVL
jgi:hypothetical protein